MSPQSAEFYAAASSYFWRRVRSHRNYGRFFVLLSTLSWALMFAHWGRWKLALSMLPGFLFFAIVGWIVIIGAAKNYQLLYDADHETHSQTKLQRLRQVALSYRGDSVSVVVLEFTERDEHVNS